MNRFKNHLIAAAVFSVLAIIGTMMNSRPSVLQAAGGPTVTIDQAQLPLPVQGSLGITGTANVKVTNPAAAPVLALNVNDPGRIPYQSMLFSICPDGSLFCAFAFPTVPSGHRLVIQHVSIEAGTKDNNSGTGVVILQIVSSTSPISNPILLGDFTLTTPFSNPNAAVHPPVFASQSVLGYADAGLSPNVGIQYSGGLSGNIPGLPNSGPRATLTGYLLDCTIAPCAAIAP
jgi:hypothetical protein